MTRQAYQQQACAETPREVSLSITLRDASSAPSMSSIAFPKDLHPACQNRFHGLHRLNHCNQKEEPLFEREAATHEPSTATLFHHVAPWPTPLPEQKQHSIIPFPYYGPKSAFAH